MSSKREFRNRLHEQLARRTARDAVRAAAGAVPIRAQCEPCESQFEGGTEDELRSALEEHYKTASHRMATQLPMHKQRREN